jgi:hypothetical protein
VSVCVCLCACVPVCLSLCGYIHTYIHTYYIQTFENLCARVNRWAARSLLTLYYVSFDTILGARTATTTNPR